MKRMKKIMTLAAVLAGAVLLGCGNKERQPEPIAVDDQFVVEGSRADTISTPSQIESSKEEKKPSTHVSSSFSTSRTSKSTKYDNMRGFDPASEDDKRITGRFFDPLKMAEVRGMM